MNQVVIDQIPKMLNDFFARSGFSKLAVLTDENTRKHCYPLIRAHLPEHLVIQIESGEIHKSLESCKKIWEALTHAAFDRESLLINLGGGVIGDMGGFCATAFKRGIRFLNIPTTLLAAVDASVGGKLGIDFHGFKNHLGFFQEPETALIDPVFLQTLPQRELRSGFAEIIKHGLIADKDYFEQIMAKGLDQSNWHAVISHSVEIKSAVVKADPKESGLRKVLNFGHTIGHALESFYLDTPYALLHGEAVAIGMIGEAYLSKKLLGLPETSLEEITGGILNIYEKQELDQKQFPEILDLMYQDKKNIGNELNFSLLRDTGNATFDIAVDEKDVLDALFYYEKLKR